MTKPFDLNDNQLLRNQSYINGQWRATDTSFPVINPATTQILTHVGDATADDVVTAVVAAKRALPLWAAKTANERANMLRRWYDLIIEHSDDLARLLTLEQGKPLPEAKSEILYGASFIEWFAEEGKRIYGDTIPANASHTKIIVIKQPIGVVAAITPWNFPNAMIARKAAAALAAGCSFVVRPSEYTPLSALALAELADRAGLPKGVFNVVVGNDATTMGKVLTQHPDVAKFTFTGSTAVGKLLTQQCATTVKKVSMELGGNAPFIVFADADISAAVAGLIASKYRNAGQTCICSNRIFVHDSIVAKFTAELSTAVQQLNIGDGLNAANHIGPMITQQALDNVHQLVSDSIAQGAVLHLGGHVDQAGSHFYAPTILTHVTNRMALAQHEIFGPVAPIISFTDEDEVIALANDTPYGLAAYFYARDIGTVWRVSEKLEFGMIGINESAISNAAAPFGGIKESGNGREGSKYGLDDYLEIKYLCMGGLGT